MDEPNLKPQKKHRNTNIQVNLSEVSIPNSKKSVSFVSTTSSTQVSSRSSRFFAAIKESVASIAKSIAKIVFIRDDDGCTLGSCRVFIWINGAFLFTMGILLLLAWADLDFDIFTDEKYFKNNFVPNWPVFKEPRSFIACWIVMFTCSAWILIAGFIRSVFWMRAYTAIVPWFLTIPISFCLFYVLYIGPINERNAETVLYDRMGDISTMEDLEIWNTIQNKFQCCGVKDNNGWKDWRDATEFNDIFAGEDAVPQSCCLQTKQGPHRLCQSSPNRYTHKKACTSSIVKSYHEMGSFVITVLVISIIAKSYSVFSATRFYWFLAESTHMQKQSKATRCCLECLCPCRICCKRYRIVPQDEGRASTGKTAMEKIQEDLRRNKLRESRDSNEEDEEELIVLHESTAQVQSSDEEMDPRSSVPPVYQRQ